MMVTVLGSNAILFLLHKLIASAYFDAGRCCCALNIAVIVICRHLCSTFSLCFEHKGNVGKLSFSTLAFVAEEKEKVHHLNQRFDIESKRRLCLLEDAVQAGK